MTPFRFKFLINTILLVVGFFLPPLYFLLKKRIWIAIATLVVMVIGHGYGILFCMALAVISALIQFFIDWKYRDIIAENLQDDWSYKTILFVLTPFGSKPKADGKGSQPQPPAAPRQPRKPVARSVVEKDPFSIIDKGADMQSFGDPLAWQKQTSGEDS